MNGSFAQHALPAPRRSHHLDVVSGRGPDIGRATGVIWLEGIKAFPHEKAHDL